MVNDIQVKAERPPAATPLTGEQVRREYRRLLGSDNIKTYEEVFQGLADYVNAHYESRGVLPSGAHAVRERRGVATTETVARIANQSGALQAINEAELYLWPYALRQSAIDAVTAHGVSVLDAVRAVGEPHHKNLIAEVKNLRAENRTLKEDKKAALENDLRPIHERLNTLEDNLTGLLAAHGMRHLESANA